MLNLISAFKYRERAFITLNHRFKIMGGYLKRTFIAFCCETLKLLLMTCVRKIDPGLKAANLTILQILKGQVFSIALLNELISRRLLKVSAGYRNESFLFSILNNFCEPSIWRLSTITKMDSLVTQLSKASTNSVCMP